MRTSIKALPPRVIIASPLLAIFAALMLVALLSATSHARRVDTAARHAANFLSEGAIARGEIERGLDGGRLDRKAIVRAGQAAAAAADEASSGIRAGNAIRTQTNALLRAPAGNEARRQAIALRTTLGTLIEGEQARSANRSNNLSASLKRTLALGIVGLVGLALSIFILASGLVRSITIPMRRLAADARRLGKGDLSTRVTETGGLPDVRDLGASLNSMAASLERSRSALAGQRDAIAASREEAERANHAKSEFLSRMSHELRTPLNSILGFAQLMEVENLDAEQRDNVAHIVGGGRHLLNLINEVLEISRIEAGAISPTIEPVQAATIVNEAIELVSPLAAERGIELRTQLGSHKDAWVAADTQRLKQVVLNLLANAVKYNRDEGSVTVSFRKRDDRLRILVTDTGQGIPQDQVPKLFTPFERLGADASGVEGTGLGLVLALRLMEAMNGTIAVESQPWIGSTFQIELPLADSPAPEPAANDEERAALRRPAPHAGSQRTILYVEDDMANIRLMTRLFEAEPQLKLETTMQGKLALELARMNHPDLILLDLHLPDIDGSDVIRRLRADDITRDIPVIMVSADASEETKARLRTAGAQHYLTKPLQLDLVLATVLETLDGPTPSARPTAGAAL